MSFIFQMDEKLYDERRVEIIDLQIGRRPPQAVTWKGVKSLLLYFSRYYQLYPKGSVSCYFL